MENTKTFAKFWLIVHVLSGAWMVINGIYGSFSQHSTSTNDWALRLYLASGSWVFLTLMLRGHDRLSRIKMGWAKIRHWHIWMIISICFVGVSATNVIDYSIPDPNQTDPTRVFLHFVFTGLLALSATVFSWHYYPRYLKDGKINPDRKWTMLACAVGGLSFGLSVLGTNLGWSFISIAIGELIISICISLVAWPVINEQLN